mgnify:CR=1 FL=1
MLKLLSMALISIFVVNCASVHSGHMAKDEKGKSSSQGGLSVSGLENSSLSSKYFLALDFTIENSTADWIVVEEASLTFLNSDLTSKMIVPVGKDLSAWAEAAQQNAEINSYNTAMILGAVAGAGAIGSRASDAGVAKASTLALIGAGSAMTVNSINQNMNDVERAKILPESHLYAGNFAVPPGLHAKKWVTLYTKEPSSIPYLREVELNVKVKNGQNYKFKIPFRRGLVPSDFQSSHPENDPANRIRR